ncbi:MAG: type pilus assembly protein PilN [Frankiales bacterium]|jgi:Tfp pilus assembly protein PilN|nr:type pilus assembly protein PilN [Frankiales bacterium]
MTTQTTVVGTPTLPRVNLLPPEIAEARTLQQYRLGAAGAVVLAALAVGAVYYQGHGGVATAQSALDASTSKTAALNAQLSSLQNVTQVKNQVLSAKATLNSALSPQILWSHYLQDMSVSLAGNYWFTGMAMTSSAGPAAGAATAASPLADPAAIGSITLTGSAVSHYDVADLLRALAKEKGLSDKPVVTSSAKAATAIAGNSLVTFSVTESVDSNGRPSATGLGTSSTTPTTTPTKPAGN